LSAYVSPVLSLSALLRHLRRPTDLYPLSLHDALPIWTVRSVLQKSVVDAAPARRPAHQRPAFGARALAMRRASRLSTMTNRTSTRAAAQARSELAIAAAPGETGRSCESQI